MERLHHMTKRAGIINGTGEFTYSVDTEGSNLYKHRPSHEDRLPEKWYFDIEYKCKHQTEERGDDETMELKDEIGSAIIRVTSRPASVKKSPKKPLRLTYKGGPRRGIDKKSPSERSESDDEESAATPTPAPSSQPSRKKPSDQTRQALGKYLDTGYC